MLENVSVKLQHVQGPANVSVKLQNVQGRLAKQHVIEEHFILLSNLNEFNRYNVIYFIITD